MSTWYFGRTEFIALCICILVWTFCAGSIPRESNTKTFLFAGDIYFAETYQEKLAAQGKINILKAEGYDYTVAGMDPVLAGADIVIGNLETPITSVAASPHSDNSKDWIHKGDIVRTPVTLQNHRLSIVSLANNHTMDFGPPGLDETVQILKKHSIGFFGAGQNESEASLPYQFRDTIGKRHFHLVVVGGLEYSDTYADRYRFYASENASGVKAWTTKKAIEQIRKIRQSDPKAFIVAFPHWLENYKWKTQQETLLAHAVIEAGADIVIGHGPHMFQEVERYQNKWIIYSLGNFVFNSPGRFRKEKAHPYSLAAMLTVTDRPTNTAIKLRLYPIVSDNRITNYRPRLVNQKEFEQARSLLLQHSPESEALSKNLAPGEDQIGSYMELVLK